jgi:heme oxygenase
MQRRVELCLGPVAADLAFHAYPALDDIPAFAAAYRADLDRAIGAADFDRVAAEAEKAFQLNIALSEAVAGHAMSVPDDTAMRPPL